MMIKDLTDFENLSMNVMMKDGTKFEGMDIPSRPLGDNEKFVTFWIGDVVRMYPVAEVAYVELVPTNA